MHVNQPKEPVTDAVISPFSDVDRKTPLRKRSKSASLWMLLGLSLVVVAAVGGFFLFSYLQDPLRTLEIFPSSKYLEEYKALAGSRFQGDLRVENDLGWKEGVGRLMAFTLRDDTRPIVVMIPPEIAGLYFTKGQSYSAELEVKEGGLIYANSIRKN